MGKKKPKTGWGSRVHVRYPSRGDGVTGGGGYIHTRKREKERKTNSEDGSEEEGREAFFFCHVQLPVADE